PFNGAMLEVQRDISARDHVLARWGYGSSDTLNRQYVLDYAHNFVPNFKATVELRMAPESIPGIGFALDWAGPWEPRARYAAPAPISHFTNTPQAESAAADSSTATA